MYQDLISGAVAGVVSRTMVAPIELYRVQRQNSFIPNTIQLVERTSQTLQRQTKTL